MSEDGGSSGGKPTSRDSVDVPSELPPPLSKQEVDAPPEPGQPLQEEPAAPPGGDPEQQRVGLTPEESMVADAGDDGGSTPFPDPGSGSANDPFPEIPPALLNAADISDYVRALTPPLLSPFDVTRLKPASYAIGVGGRYATVRPREERDGGGSEWVIQDVSGQDAAIPLRPNSIVYVSLDTKIDLPLFIASRFNLCIKHVYRGLLAGTGPLVDPGFDGDLYVPIHNLSSNEYSLRPGEGLIWMEFTKLSPHPSWLGDPNIQTERSGKMRSLPPEKVRADLREYLDHASTSPIQSSIEYAIGDVRTRVDQAQRSARNAEEQLNRARRLILAFGWGAAFLFLVALATMLASVWLLIDDSNSSTPTVPPSSGVAPTTPTTRQAVPTTQSSAAVPPSQPRQP